MHILIPKAVIFDMDGSAGRLGTFEQKIQPALLPPIKGSWSQMNSTMRYSAAIQSLFTGLSGKSLVRIFPLRNTSNCENTI